MRRTVGRFRKSDYIYGVEKEEEVRNILQTYFGGNICKSLNKKERYDCFDEQNIFEIKSRKNKMNDYPTTVITTDKVIQTNKKIFFVFNFESDCVGFIEYSYDKFKNYNIKYIFNKPNFEIPVEDLTIIYKYQNTCLI